MGIEFVAADPPAWVTESFNNGQHSSQKVRTHNHEFTESWQNRLTGVSCRRAVIRSHLRRKSRPLNGRRTSSGTKSIQ